MDAIQRSIVDLLRLRGRPRRARAVVSLLAALAMLLAALPRGPISIAEAAPCDPPIANPIVCENSKTGNPSSEWDLGGVSSSAIRGFATDISVAPGGTVRFKVTTTASAYRIDIYRIGYYGGLGARKIGTVPNTATTKRNQPACLVGPADANGAATGLIDCCSAAAPEVVRHSKIAPLCGVMNTAANAESKALVARSITPALADGSVLESELT